jgi:sRNA-binding carbon storage regulator CsrA
MAEKTHFKSLFKNKNIESFRKELYKYIHSNKSNPKLVDKLLKLLYKP